MRLPPKPLISRYIAVPSSLFREVDEPLRTLYIGLLARAAAIYRVEEITVYREGGVKPHYIVQVLRYLRTPQYMRRRLFPRSRALRYVGVTPPLATPSHPVSGEDVEYREGVVVDARRGWLYVDAGLGKPLRVKGEGKRGDIIIVKKAERGWMLYEGQPPGYWCYDVKTAQGLQSTIEYYRRRGSLVVATSRKGVNIRKVKESIVNDSATRGSVVLLYGLWARGLYEIASLEGFKLDEEVDYVVNFIPDQGTRTVRTVEAVHASLAIVNMLIS